MRPNCFIAGFYKCGTTTLYDVLSQHRNILVSPEKENDFFMDEYLFNKGIEWYEKKYYGELINRDAGLVMEINPHLSRKFGTAKRLRKYYPQNTKLLFILRNPVEAYFSHFKFSVQLGEFPFVDTYKCKKYSFSEAFDMYLKRNPIAYKEFEFFYSRQLLEYGRLFEKDTICYVFLEDLKQDSMSFYSKIFNFFGIEMDENIDYEQRSNAVTGMPIHILWLKCFVSYRKILKLLPDELSGSDHFQHIYDLLYRVFDYCKQDNSKMSTTTERNLQMRFNDEKKRIERITGRELKEIWW